MTGSEIKEFFRLYHKIDSLASEIFDKFDDADLLASNILS